MDPMNEQQQVTNETMQTEQVEMSAQENMEQSVTETLNESSLEASLTDVKSEEGMVDTQKEENVVEDQPVVSEEIQKKLDKLKEYEVKENELNELKQRLGTNTQQDNLIFGAQQELAKLENIAQQEYIKLCNEYGVDYRPDKIDASSLELQQKDPKAFYELRYKLEQLVTGVDARRNQVQTFIEQRDLGLAMERHRQVLDTSPAIKQVVDTLIQQGGMDGAQIDNIVGYAMMVAREAFEMGRQSVGEITKPTQVNPSTVLNNNVITQQTGAGLPTETLTLADVEKMDTATYAKNAALIDKLYAEGRLK